MSEHDPTPDAEPLESVDAEDAELLLADPEDYHRAQRLREIHDARREVHRALRECEARGERNRIENQLTHLQHAVAAYAMELRPLMEATDYDTSLDNPSIPWDKIEDYADLLGRTPDDKKGINLHTYVFQKCNDALAEIRPLIEEDTTDKWEV